MADINIKTVTLNGGEVEVNLTRRNCHIRNLGTEMIYASLKPGIVPDADGVLGVPAGAVDVLHDTDGKVYVKGNGKVQLVGSDFADGILGVVAGAGIDAQIAAEVAKLIADAPEDFDTLKEISDWIYSHADSAAEMNSEIQSLKTEKANKTDIPTSLPANGGNSDTVNGHTVESDVPVDAMFTDTTYSNATTTDAGLMSAEDKINLNSAIQIIKIGGKTQSKTNGIINLPSYATLFDVSQNQLKTSINEQKIPGTYACESWYTPDFPTGFGIFGFLLVFAYGAIVYQLMMFDTSNVIFRAYNGNTDVWTEWKTL